METEKNIETKAEKDSQENDSSKEINKINSSKTEFANETKESEQNSDKETSKSEVKELFFEDGDIYSKAVQNPFETRIQHCSDEYEDVYSGRDDIPISKLNTKTTDTASISDVSESKKRFITYKKQQSVDDDTVELNAITAADFYEESKKDNVEWKTDGDDEEYYDEDENEKTKSSTIAICVLGALIFTLAAVMVVGCFKWLGIGKEKPTTTTTTTRETYSYDTPTTEEPIYVPATTYSPTTLQTTTTQTTQTTTAIVTMSEIPPEPTTQSTTTQTTQTTTQKTNSSNSSIVAEQSPVSDSEEPGEIW